MSLRPGEDAHLPPDWVPWAERLEPSDVQPTDRLPYVETDHRLQPGFEETGEDADQLGEFEMLMLPFGCHEVIDDHAGMKDSFLFG